MNKKETALLESALEAAALRSTSDVTPDVPPPTHGGLSKGFLPIGDASQWARVDLACSSSVSHGIGSQEKTTTQQPRYLYSTRTLALKALRYAVERDCAKRLRNIDRMIEEDNSRSEGL